MKYCPFCGAALPGGAAPFCSECGKRLPAAQKASRPEKTARNRPPRNDIRNPDKRKAAQRNPAAQKSGTGPPGPRPGQARRAKPDPRYEGYDGYYDDVKPIDDGRVRERTDPELIKRIILLAAGAFFVVILAVILMSVL